MAAHKQKAARLVDEAMALLRASEGEPDLLLQAAINITKAAGIHHEAGTAADRLAETKDQATELASLAVAFEERVFAR